MRAAQVFATATVAPASASLPFGLDRFASAAALRQLANDVENGTIALESVRVITLATHEEFAYTVLRLKFYDRNLR